MRLHHFRRAMREAQAIAGQAQSRTGYYIAGAVLAGLAAVVGYELLKPKSGTLPPLPTSPSGGSSSGSPSSPTGPPPNPPATPINPQTGVPGIWPSAAPPPTPAAAPTDPVANSSLQAAAQAALNMLAGQTGAVFNAVDVATLKSQGATDAQIAPLVQQQLQAFQQSVAAAAPGINTSGKLDYLTLAVIMAQAAAVAVAKPVFAQPDPLITDPAMVGLAQQGIAKIALAGTIPSMPSGYVAPTATTVGPNQQPTLGNPTDPAFQSAIQSFQQAILGGAPGTPIPKDGSLDLNTWSLVVSMAFGR